MKPYWIRRVKLPGHTREAILLGVNLDPADDPPAGEALRPPPAFWIPNLDDPEGPPWLLVDPAQEPADLPPASDTD